MTQTLTPLLAPLLHPDPDLSPSPTPVTLTLIPTHTLSPLQPLSLTWPQALTLHPSPPGTIIEVNCSDLGLVTPSGKVVWGKYAQVTNNPENDGCINAVLLV